MVVIGLLYSIYIAVYEVLELREKKQDILNCDSNGNFWKYICARKNTQLFI